MSNVLCKSNKDIPQEMLLGNLVFMNIVDMKLAENDLLDIFTDNNIPTDYIRKISKADAFRRASSSIKNKILYFTSTSGILNKVKIEVDEVKSDMDGIKRIVGIKRVNEQQEDISYTPIGYFSFDRQTEQVVYGIDSAYLPDQGIVQTFLDVCDKYTDWSVYHNKDTVRNIINRIINDTHPISLMPTGMCKFIPQVSTDLLYNLKNALETMTAHRIQGANGNNIVEIIPIIDTEEQRDLIEKNFSAEITDELFDFTQELKKVLATKQTLTSRTATSYIEKFKALSAKAKEYESLLGIYVTAVHDQIAASLDLVNDNTDTDD